MRQALIAGNWKMHGVQADARALAEALVRGMPMRDDVEAVVCPPYVHLPSVAAVLADSAIQLGAQNCADAEPGARTGEIAATMLGDLGVHYVILGHSERREYYAESDVQIAQRYQHAVAHGLRPILCVGETLAQRDAEQTESVVAGQLHGVLDALGEAGLSDGVIAYEPVWAIGTGRTATAEQAQAMHAFIRATLAKRLGDSADTVRLLYGGSMKPANADELLAQPDVDGGLVGGASLSADDFAAIYAAAARG